MQSVMLLAGIGQNSVLAALNARSRQSRSGHLLAAGNGLFVVAFTVSLVVAMLVGRQGFAPDPRAQKHLLWPVFYKWPFLHLVDHLYRAAFRVGNACSLLVGQLFSEAAMDHFGLFGAAGVALGARARRRYRR